MPDDDQVTTDDASADADQAEETPVEETTEEQPAEETTDTSEEEASEAPAEEAPANETSSDDAPVATPAGVDAQGRQLYTTVCSNCGNETQVPFIPAAGRPVYCRDCFIKKQQESRGGN